MASGWVAYAPFITVFGPIVGALIGAVVTYLYVVKRKKVVFSVIESEDITLPVQREQHNIVFKIGDREMLNLNRASIVIKNAGNSTIENLDFKIEIPGEHGHTLTDKITKDEHLRQVIEVEPIRQAITLSSAFQVKVPFFNAKEMFEIVVFFDGVTENPNIICRMPDVAIKVRLGRPSGYIEFFGLQLRTEHVGLAMNVVGAIAAAAAFAAWTAATGIWKMWW